MGFVDPRGLIRWDSVANNSLGMLGSGVGVVLGGALMGAPTGVSQIIGGAVLAKSLYSWGASWYGLTRAFSDDSVYDLPENYQTLPRVVARSITCSNEAQKVADIADLSIDFASGRAVAGYASNMSGFLKSPVGYAPLNSNLFYHPVTYGEVSSKEMRVLSDVLGGVQSYQYGSGAWK